MKLVLQKGTNSAAGRRYYEHGGTVVAVRTSNLDKGLSWLLGDHQGTTAMTVNADTLAVGQRRQDPFGKPRGGEPAEGGSCNWCGGMCDLAVVGGEWPYERCVLLVGGRGT
ncbi:hypothetical protein [Actinokineospora spheciospongiae]|uniref:hypothetical protein n=1 Tax=Actinokineospora spheciospongiae TaxID=909613 RepID=UPI0004B566F4|nr:hypothetical protein [Actinokineospora spheciospongiae]